MSNRETKSDGVQRTNRRGKRKRGGGGGGPEQTQDEPTPTVAAGVVETDAGNFYFISFCIFICLI